MNEEDRRKYTDQLQKNLTKSCYLACSKNPKAMSSCFETCYEKYIETINETSSAIKQIGYRKNSVIAYKGYPEHSVESLLNITRTLVDTLDYAPFAIQHEHRA